MTTKRSTRFNPLWLGGLAALCVSGAMSQAYAAPPALGGEPSSMKVKFGDLNLDSQAGVETLYKRIRTAARIVCWNDTSTSDPRYFYNRRKCELTAEAKAVRDVNNRNLTAMYRAKHGEDPSAG
jgi:UrcA family protein